MDEPSLGLAPLLVAELFKTISEINLHGLTILLVEQNAQHALRLARRAYVMETGRVRKRTVRRPLHPLRLPWHVETLNKFTLLPCIGK